MFKGGGREERNKTLERSSEREVILPPELLPHREAKRRQRQKPDEVTDLYFNRSHGEDKL